MLITMSKSALRKYFMFRKFKKTGRHKMKQIVEFHVKIHLIQHPTCKLNPKFNFMSVFTKMYLDRRGLASVRI